MLELTGEPCEVSPGALNYRARPLEPVGRSGRPLVPPRVHWVGAALELLEMGCRDTDLVKEQDHRAE